jgi:hypothetical protein
MMESERHAYMRKLLQLCVELGAAIVCNDEIAVRRSEDVTEDWISDLVVNLKNKTASGYWDRERHEVWL